jgi:hypothetical protein
VNDILADDRLKTLLNGVFIGSILFLSLLPALGWAWHRVLPQHTHVFFGIIQPSGDDEILPALPALNEPVLCSNCQGTQIESGVVHLPSSLGLQVLGMAGTLAVFFLLGVLPMLSERVMFPPFLYCSPTLVKLNPPPKQMPVR